MKPNANKSPHFYVLARTFLVAVGVLALSIAHTFADVVSATYTTGEEVPVSVLAVGADVDGRLAVPMPSRACRYDALVW